ncbi:hypothetical protein SAMN05216327_107353 [Dyadobacter sp. SG02]|nr:hypothetical protein SAMN05216327_107353 [Dyadobacter sp. SG02]
MPDRMGVNAKKVVLDYHKKRDGNIFAGHNITGYNDGWNKSTWTNQVN